MKEKSFAIIVSLVLFTLIAAGQTGQQLKGMWEGKLNVGVELRIVFHFQPFDNGGVSATLDSPDQSVFGLLADTVTVFADNVQVKINKIKADFSGKLINDSTIDGYFSQLVKRPLVLKKTDKISVPKRAQTPQPPFPYKTEDIEYENAEKTLHYGATITIPIGKGPFPAALLITGSGPQDRNETLADHQLFAVIADALTREGFIVLRVDDRGVGKSTGIFSDATSADFAMDVNTSFDYLLSRPETDKKRAGLIGHSEGGMIAPVVASGRNDVDFMVLLAAPGIKITDLMAEQNAAILRSVFINPDAIEAYIPMYKKMLEQIPANSDSAKALVVADSLLGQWLATADSSYIAQLGFDSEETVNRVAARFAREFNTKWMRYFLSFDPQVYLQKLKKTKVLALNGNRDIQVISSSNLDGIRSALKKSKTKNYTIKELEGLNHLFQTCHLCTLAEYVALPETFSPAAIQVIKDWLKKNVAL